MNTISSNTEYSFLSMKYYENVRRKINYINFWPREDINFYIISKNIKNTSSLPRVKTKGRNSNNAKALHISKIRKILIGKNNFNHSRITNSEISEDSRTERILNKEISISNPFIMKGISLDISLSKNIKKIMENKSDNINKQRLEVNRPKDILKLRKEMQRNTYQNLFLKRGKSYFKKEIIKPNLQLNNYFQLIPDLYMQINKPMYFYRNRSYISKTFHS